VDSDLYDKLIELSGLKVVDNEKENDFDLT
jgi:hypothetical protein